MVVLAVTLPALAQAPADVEAFYFAKIPRYGYTTDGVKFTYDYRYIGVELEQEDEVVTGHLWGFNASSVRGCKAQGGTSTYNATVSPRSRQSLVFGTQNVTVTAAGQLGVYLTTGCWGVAGNVTGNITGDVDLESGWNSLNVTNAGNIFICVHLAYTEIGELAGAVGSSRIAVVGPNLVTWLDAGNATILGVSEVYPGNETRIFAPGGIFVVTGNGTIEVLLPEGSSGNVTGDDVTVDGEASANLTVGLNEIDVVTDVTGTITFNIQTNLAYQLTGRVSTGGWWSSTLSIFGRVEGFFITNHDPWEGELISFTVKAKESSFNPIED